MPIKKAFRKPRPKKILCVVEGATEKSFLEHVKQLLGRKSVTFKDAGGEGSPTAIIQKAEQDFDQDIHEKCVIVFDGDRMTKEDIAICKKWENTFGIYVVRPCFELWIYLHFEDDKGRDPANKCSVYQRKLDVYFPPKYSKKKRPHKWGKITNQHITRARKQSSRLDSLLKIFEI